MADSVVQAGWNIADRNKNYNTATDFDPTVNRWKDKEQLEEESKDKSQLSFTDMLGLMVTQNQSIDNQASTTDMMNQLVQMTTMQAMTALTTKMDEVALANVMSYSASLVGKEVTVGVWNEQTGKLEEIVGVVKGSGTYDGQQVIYLDNGKGYFLSDIMAVGTLPPKTEKPGEEGDGEGDKTEGTPGTGEGDSNDTTTKPPETEGSGDAGNSQDPDGAVG